MSAYRRWSQAVLAAFLLVFTITAWIVFAPLQVGGQVTYVIVTGNSMEPDFHSGDLVIVHQASDYRVGDIVAYLSPELRSLVFHRIIGMDLDHFILKGDNNSWTDSYQPTQEELLGKLWLHIPRAGNVVRWLRTPLNMAIITGVLGTILMVSMMKRSKHGKGMKKKSKWEWLNTVKKWVYRNFIGRPSQSSLVKALRVKMGRVQHQRNRSRKSVRERLNIVKGWAKRNFVERLSQSSLIKTFRAKKSGAIILKTATPEIPSASVRDQKAKNRGQVMEGLFFILGLFALAALVLGIFAFNRPLWHDVPNDVKYTHTGMFSYTATAPPGVYDSETVVSGDPLFPALNCSINLQFNYTLTGDQLQDLVGTHQITAKVIENASGWHRTIPLEQEKAFSGNTYISFSSLDLCQVEAIVSNMEQITELHASYYSLIISPSVTITGKVAGRDLQGIYNPTLVFQFDKVHFYLVNDDPTVDPLNPSEMGLIKSVRTEANTLTLFGLKPQVSRMRTLSVIGLCLALGGLLILGLFISNTARRSQESFVEMKYGSILVDIQDRTLETSPAIEVVTMDDLAKLAERHNSLILHGTRGLIHYYLVQGDRITYRYKLSEYGDSSLPTSPALLEDNLRQGLERGEFQVYYQPIMSLTDDKITAVEALLRWQHPQRGLVTATDFILTAEKTGLIDKIGAWMVEVACIQFKEWQEAGIQICLAINLSERQLERDPAGFISRVLQETGVDPHTLQLEIPETSLSENARKVLPNLQKLKDFGIQLSVDNFAGQSPLSSLGKLPINSVKIDRRIIERISDPNRAVTVSGMITSVLEMGLNVVAEGVETEEQLKFLQDRLCTLAQGYLLGRPESAQKMTRHLRQRMNMVRSKPSGRGTLTIQPEDPK